MEWQRQAPLRLQPAQLCPSPPGRGPNLPRTLEATPQPGRGHICGRRRGWRCRVLGTHQPQRPHQAAAPYGSTARPLPAQPSVPSWQGPAQLPVLQPPTAHGASLEHLGTPSGFPPSRESPSSPAPHIQAPPARPIALRPDLQPPVLGLLTSLLARAPARRPWLHTGVGWAGEAASRGGVFPDSQPFTIKCHWLLIFTRTVPELLAAPWLWLGPRHARQTIS